MEASKNNKASQVAQKTAPNLALLLNAAAPVIRRGVQTSMLQPQE